MTTKDMDLDCYGINLETADNEAFKRMITDELESKIDTLQRYFLVEYNVHENKYQEGKSEYIRYDDLKKLLQSDTESI